MFDFFDEDADGSVTKYELIDKFQQQGGASFEQASLGAYIELERYDRNRNGEITLSGMFQQYSLDCNWLSIGRLSTLQLSYCRR